MNFVLLNTELYNGVVSSLTETSPDDFTTREIDMMCIALKTDKQFLSYWKLSESGHTYESNLNSNSGPVIVNGYNLTNKYNNNSKVRKILKLPDEWYIVEGMIKINNEKIYRIYKCDQLDGLIECINYLINA